MRQAERIAHLPRAMLLAEFETAVALSEPGVSPRWLTYRRRLKILRREIEKRLEMAQAVAKEGRNG